MNNTINTVLTNVNVAFGELYNYIKDYINKNGGYIYTYSEKTSVMSLEYTNAYDASEWVILGLRVVGDRIEYLASYDGVCEIENPTQWDLTEYGEWEDLFDNTYYFQTMMNIAKYIEKLEK